MQFGFMPYKGTTDADFVVRQLYEKLEQKGKKVYFGFVDLERHLTEYQGSGMLGYRYIGCRRVVGISCYGSVQWCKNCSLNSPW